MDTPQSFGELLRRHRSAAGLTQEELAERAGLSARGIANLERGVRNAPYPRTVRQLSEVLRLSDDERAVLIAARARAHDSERYTGDSARGYVVPVPPTTLVGRDGELDRIKQRLVEERVRLLTVAGTGGIGKTRLAVEVASELRETFKNGVWFVDLTAIRDPGLVLPAIARVLGVYEESRHPTRAALEQFLRNKHLLLVLDNCEQVVAAAPEVGALLERCPDVQVLATSREPLRLRWERLFPVPPLGLPPADAMLPLNAVAAAPAVVLFVQRAQDLEPSSQLRDETVRMVADLCRRLDGLPLAIELAAAHMATLPPAALLARGEKRLDLLHATMQDAPTRHQTLRAAIDWSHQLLSDTERAVFRRMAIFAGGCSLEAAQVVCQMGRSSRIDVLDHLEALVNKGLVKSQDAEGQARFGMLETIREYAFESLERSGELTAISDAHAAYYLELPELTEPLLHSREN